MKEKRKFEIYNFDDTDSKDDDSFKKQNKLLSFLRIFFKVSFFALFILFIGLIMSGYVYYLKVKSDFKREKPRTNTTQSIFYDKDGGIIYESYGARESSNIPLNELPDAVIKATLAAEDLDFYKHDAYDLKGILRAVYKNYKNTEKRGINKLSVLFDEDSYSEGGSTITQQLVKNRYLNSEKSFNRKIKEVIYANELEKKYSKDKILEMYINEIYFGEQAIGIQNASKIYFDKDAKKLNLAEASILAGLPQAPTKYSPISGDFLESKKRQEYVLQRMILAGFIDLDMAKSAANEDLIFANKKDFLKKYPYFVDWIKKEIDKKYGDGFSEKGGIKVYTALDPKIQEIAEKAVEKNLNNFKYRKVENSSVVVLEPENNQVLAMVGGKNYDESKVNVATSLRQPGSSFKPFVYLAGLEKGFTARTKFIDKYVNFGGIPPYAPRNYDGGYHGYVTMRQALSWSLNIPAVEMLNIVGLDEVINLGENLGIGLDDAKRCGLSLALGCKEIRLLDLAGAYSAIYDKGQWKTPSGITKITDNKDEIIFLNNQKKRKIFSEENAYIITNILSDINTRRKVFGWRNKLELDRPAAAKTGTTDNYTDSWTLGFTPDFVTGVWMGNNDRTPMLRTSGIEGAAYIWNDVMTEIHKDLPKKEFEKPDGVIELKINSSSGQIETKYNGILEVFKKGTEPKGKDDLSHLRGF